ncbi:hypothetical protein Dde_2478 [Oleidesulfovibrio alaskensis G20]|jgi:hypothetical protein|uniref:Uncharacterized protein n=1 Tax=Oleidesulfovibrio alaskensis (strain ATCC BAA-1058 / DSM 17464 / G20) TaxID=207559 RepID=Q30YH1_OLEA2|nr:hypothetical protein [Oleidesulfovibrio alaskensis]ABB39275.1 hypothetical protein Dde_2478 [Oleidesulfovibrio alaskensis G20]MBG0771975.1 hypothetical protein [Oleidesulfovibrio alaskensis]MBL3581787.1 hypothetical protein [Oleidesulfovibrio alaskensis]
MNTSDNGSTRPRHPVDALSTFLEDTARQIRRLEQQAEHALHEKNDQQEYRRLLAEKATVLSELPALAEARVAALPDSVAGAVRERLERFAQSASNALRIGSIFYMSALLYPEHHKEGDKNDLERYADEVRDIRY